MTNPMRLWQHVHFNVRKWCDDLFNNRCPTREGEESFLTREDVHVWMSSPPHCHDKFRMQFKQLVVWAGFICFALNDAYSIQKAGWLPHVGHRLHQIWNEGRPELYVTGLAWHNRYFYTSERLQTHHYNEFAAGGGIGKGFYDEDKDWHALYAMGFSDSHRNFQPLAGYGFLKMLYLPNRFHLGGGFTLFATQRTDIFHGIPFIGMPLPMVSFGADRLSIFATYVPGSTNIGNVLFVFAKWSIDG